MKIGDVLAGYEEVAPVHASAFIHSKAHVENAQIGARTRVWQFASITRGARLGEDCSVAPGAMLDGCQFGNRVLIGPSVSMGPGFLVKDDVFIGPSVTFCNDMWPITCKTGWRIEDLQAGKWAVIVGCGASIGANAVILPGVVIGEGAFVAAGAVCGKSVPDGHLFGRDGSLRKLAPPERRIRMRQAC